VNFQKLNDQVTLANPPPRYLAIPASIATMQSRIQTTKKIEEDLEGGEIRSMNEAVN
jgi:hypothetical protein